MNDRKLDVINFNQQRANFTDLGVVNMTKIVPLIEFSSIEFEPLKYFKLTMVNKGLHENNNARIVRQLRKCTEKDFLDFGIHNINNI